MKILQEDDKEFIMPCRDDRDDYDTINEIQARNNTLSRVACKIMTVLEELDDGTAEAIILKDQEVAEWWRAHKEADRKRKLVEEKAAREEAEKARLAQVKKELMRTLTADQKKALGIK